jgi:hypothetical protein
LFSKNKLHFSLSPFNGCSLPYYAKSNFVKPYFRLTTKAVYGINVFSHYKISEKFISNIGLSISKLAYGFNAVRFLDSDVILGVKQTINMRFLKLLLGVNYNLKKHSIGFSPFIAFAEINKYKGGGPTPYSTSNETISYIEGAEYFFHEINNPYFGIHFNYSRTINKRISLIFAYDYLDFADGIMNYHIEITKLSGQKQLIGKAQARVDMASFGLIYKFE